MFSIQPQQNNDHRETSESAGQNKSQRQTIRVDGARLVRVCRVVSNERTNLRQWDFKLIQCI